VTPTWVPKGPWIDGEAVAGSEGELAVISPSDGTTLATVGAAGPALVSRAAAQAQEAFRDGRWRGIPVLERQRIMMRAAEALRSHDGELAHLIASEMGMPESAARYIEIPYAAGVLDYYAGLVSSIAGETLPVDIPGVEPNYLAYTVRQPISVVGLITPWNFPLLLPMWKIAPALAAGSAVVLKPAPESPLTALALVVLLESAGVPPGVVNVLPGSDAVGAALVEAPAVRHVSFTGSTAVGREVAARAGGDLKRVSLELGGKSPALVFADADLDNAVSQCLFGIYFNSGQVCQASSRILVQDSIYDQFLAQFVARAKGLHVGPATDPTCDLGPVVRPDRLVEIQRLVEAAAQDGAQVRLGGQVLPGPGFYYPPTVVTEVTPGMALYNEEVFGPVAAITSFTTDEEALALADATPYGLAAAVFTKDLRRALTASRTLTAGTVWINTSQVQSPTAPFGGMKASGMGRELGRAGLEQFLETKTVLVDLHEAPPTYF